VSNVNDVVGAALLRLTAFALVRRVNPQSLPRGSKKTPAFTITSLTSEKVSIYAHVDRFFCRSLANVGSRCRQFKRHSRTMIL
jgi:hypothetical protein